MVMQRGTRTLMILGLVTPSRIMITIPGDIRTEEAVEAVEVEATKIEMVEAVAEEDIMNVMVLIKMMDIIISMMLLQLMVSMSDIQLHLSSTSMVLMLLEALLKLQQLHLLQPVHMLGALEVMVDACETPSLRAPLIPLHKTYPCGIQSSA